MSYILCQDDDIGTGDEENADGTPSGYLKRRKIRKVQGVKKLKDETKAAQKAEEERRKRIEERQKEVGGILTVLGAGLLLLAWERVCKLKFS